MADLLDFAPVRVFTSNAAPGAGYIARFYQSGTTTPVTVYSDLALNTALGSSVTADAEGVFPAVFSAGGAIKATIETPAGAVVTTVDPVQSVAGGAAAAETVTFTPTVDLPFTNVQAAIEGAAASAASGFTPFGLGVTGSVELLANLDATNIATGQYRFDGTTTGTYPTGVSASDTGAVQLVRETSGSAWMVLYHDTTDRTFYRRMASSTWGTWRELLHVNIGATEGDIIYRGASAWTRLAKGTAGQSLRMNSGATAPEWGSNQAFTFLASQNTTSGTAFDFTGIPAGVNEVIVDLNAVSVSGADDLLVQLGVSGGPVTTGYGGSASIVAATSASSTAYTTGAGLRISSAGLALSGRVRIERLESNRWQISHLLTTRGGTNATANGCSIVDIGAELTQIRLTRSGSDTFDGGSARVGYR